MRLTQLWKSPNYANKSLNYSSVSDSGIPVWLYDFIKKNYIACFNTPLEFFFQEQSYSSLHSGRSLTWDHVRGNIDDPCGAIANFCGVITDPCDVVVIPQAIDAATPIVARLAKHHKTLLNIVKHYETHVKHCEPLIKHLKTMWNIMKQSSFDATRSAHTSSLDAETSALCAATSAIARSYWRYRRGVSGNIGDCGVGITPQMFNRITNHGDMSTFSKPAVQ